MIRWIIVLAALLLSGCITTREVVYRDRYHDGYAQSRYDERYSDDGSYYSPPQSGRGDYYYRPAPRRGYGYSHDAWLWDYPAYYSVFWPMYRSWYDPFWHPSYYYGVTYYPRNYFSLSFHGGWGWPHHGYLNYSPYRYSWVDNYYDWSPWHHRGNRHWEAPRYGSARNEAERLARMGEFGRGAPVGAYAAGDPRGTVYDGYGRARDGRRAADYGPGGGPRQEPEFRGFGVREPGRDVPRVGGGEREAPIEAGFASPRGESRYGRVPAEATPRRGWGDEQRPVSEAGEELGRWQGQAPAREMRRQPRASVDEYALPQTSRSYGRPATTQAYRGAERALPAPRGYQAAPRYESYPEPRYERAEPQFESRPEPSYERAEPQFESRPEPSYERAEPRYEASPAPSYSREDSRSDDGGGEVRRVGSNREH